MTISRRDLLRRGTAFGVISVVAGGCGDDGGSSDGGTEGTSGTGGTGGDDLPQYEYEGDPGPEGLFAHGVASGDPLPDSVILWTRVTDPSATGPVEGFFEVALDPDFTQRVAADYVDATPERDYTIKLDVSGLEPGTTYYYRFFALGRESLIGRTRTAADAMVDRMRMVFCSCSSLAHGYFHAYKRIAERADLDLVIHLGDYIYEYADGEYGDVRTYDPPHEIVTLEDYRRRYAHYRLDPDLQQAHRQHPWVVVWDDHETANDAYKDGAENHQSGEGEWSERKAAAYQAYAEWLPIREGEAGIIYRTLRFGDLLDLVMLDTRIVGRDEQAISVSDTETIDDPARSLLGADQEAWFSEQMSTSTAQWRIIGQQVMLGHLHLAVDTPLNIDQWDGYASARDRFLEAIGGTGNVVVLTGDIHSSWAMDIAPDPYDAMAYDPETGAGALAVELVTPGITSPGFPDNLANVGPQLLMINPHLKWVDTQQRGYAVLDVTPERVQSDWFHVANVEDPAGDAEMFAKAFLVADGVPHVVQQGAPVDPRPDPPPLAP